MNKDETNDILKEILKWQKLQSIIGLKEVLPSILDNEKKLLAYELTNGVNSRETIARKVNVSTGTISNLWSVRSSHGIINKVDSRYNKIISINDLGISFEKINKIKD